MSDFLLFRLKQCNIKAFGKFLTIDRKTWLAFHTKNVTEEVNVAQQLIKEKVIKESLSMIDKFFEKLREKFYLIETDDFPHQFAESSAEWNPNHSIFNMSIQKQYDESVD